MVTVAAAAAVVTAASAEPPLRSMLAVSAAASSGWPGIGVEYLIMVPLVVIDDLVSPGAVMRAQTVT
ncbi:hypothetical protein GCM10014719_54850 [Planomonospora parontospora subsp. antibiotica]|nr:hypothetical protein GCM10014719_54850 [Planomonospora parontospora subsp. antibiotica]GII19401.1 hypothetical protein Ppa05_61270 [Planomonospora parontospora subsp. antibiotica]